MPTLTKETLEGLRDSVAKDEQAARLLDRAASRIEVGWCRVHDATNQHGEAVPPHARTARCWCMRGAILGGVRRRGDCEAGRLRRPGPAGG